MKIALSLSAIFLFIATSSAQPRTISKDEYEKVFEFAVSKTNEAYPVVLKVTTVFIENGKTVRTVTEWNENESLLHSRIKRTTVAEGRTTNSYQVSVGFENVFCSEDGKSWKPSKYECSGPVSVYGRRESENIEYSVTARSAKGKRVYREYSVFAPFEGSKKKDFRERVLTIDSRGFFTTVVDTEGTLDPKTVTLVRKQSWVTKAKIEPVVPPIAARGWRGLIPLQSTRQDVERLLGTRTGYYYNLNNETVYIDFSSGTCKGIDADSYKVPAGMVTRIMVIPKSETSLKALSVDVTRYKQRVEQDIAQHVFYYDEEAGESIEVFDGKVQSLTYMPKASEASLRCYSSIEEWMTANNIVCVLAVLKFDEFGVLSIGEEQERLGNLATQLKGESPDRRGWIVVYGGKDGMEAAVRRAKRIKHFLVKQKGLNSGRVLTMAAGTLDEPLVELWIAPVGQSLPPSSRMSATKRN